MGQVLVDFVVEIAKTFEIEITMELVESFTWSFFVDGSFGEISSGDGVVLVSAKGHKLNCRMWFRFKASNDVTEYEVLFEASN